MWVATGLILALVSAALAEPTGTSPGDHLSAGAWPDLTWSAPQPASSAPARVANAPADRRARPGGEASSRSADPARTLRLVPAMPDPRPFPAPTVATPAPAPVTASPRPNPSATSSREAAAPPSADDPSPSPVPPAPECTPRREGEALPHADVKRLLSAAAARQYWPISAPEIRVPPELVMAVAWQESGWQSNIIACDGGVGLMQIMPDTATWMNQRFGKSYDIADPADNAMIGATYLAWLIKWFGDRYFEGSYRVDAADCPDVDSPCLLNAVIASYNAGFGAVDVDGRIVIPNPGYVANVRALMTACECLRY
ncbi:MAG TPA: transglycosylase SLT domain-containing protein [Micromonospora sp.]